MADSTEPKKETVRIAVTPATPSKAAETRDTVRITLPSRPPPPPSSSPTPTSGGARPPLAKPLIPPAPDRPIQPPKFVPPPMANSSQPASMAAPFPAPVSSPLPGPKKETARITVLPDPPPAPASVQMKKTQPLIDMPVSSIPVAVNPITITPDPVRLADDGLPITLCWGLVGVSAVVLFIQILNYIS